MLLTPVQTCVMILAVALGAMVTRFIPFFLFPETKKQSKVITYLGQVLPPAMMGLLVVYCLKDVSLQTAPHGIPEAIAIMIILIVHKWRHNVLISIGGGTIAYMILVQKVFC